MTDGLTAGAGPADQPAETDSGPLRPRVLLMGSGELGQELTVALQRLGADVTRAAAEPDFVVAMTDAFDDEPDSWPALDAFAAQDVDVVPGAQAVRLTTDREGLRKLAADELGLPTAPFWFVESVAELEAVAAHAGFPLLVKPVAGPQGQGRSVVRQLDEVAAAWERATAGGRSRAWAEAVVDVEFLVTLIVVRSEGLSGPVIEFCPPIGHRSDDAGGLESWQPQQLSAAATDAARSIAARIVKALGGRGVFSVELMVNGDEVYFADVSAGPGDSSWVTLRTQRLSAFELQARAILGVAVDTMMVSPGAARVVDHGSAAPGEAPSGDALAAALGVPESDLRVFGPDTARWWGVALATAPDVAAARDRARQVVARLNMRDSRE